MKVPSIEAVGEVLLGVFAKEELDDEKRRGLAWLIRGRQTWSLRRGGKLPLVRFRIIMSASSC